LGFSVAVDVPLGHLDRRRAAMPGLMHDPRRARDECAASGMGRAAFEPDCVKRPSKPIHDADGGRLGPALRGNYGAYRRSDRSAASYERCLQVRVQRNPAAPSIFGCAIVRLKH
jgi:hypothetical protein